MELDQGRKVAVTGYPIVDNAGVPFAVVCFVSSSLDQQQVLTDTGSLALQVPLTGRTIMAYARRTVSSYWIH